MPRKTIPLADKQIQNAKPDPAKRVMTLFDGGGLYLEILATGVKRWRMKCRNGGKDKLMSLGSYSKVSLKEARARREAVRKMLDSGIDPAEEKKAAKAVKKAETAEHKAEQERAAEIFWKAA
jgi:hypothetical protein